MRCLVAANRVYVLGAGAPKKKPAVVDTTNDYEAIATLNFIETSLVVSASLFTEPTGFLRR